MPGKPRTFYRFPLSAIFSQHPDAEPLLGRLDFLRAFRIAGYDERAMRFSFEAYPDIQQFTATDSPPRASEPLIERFGRRSGGAQRPAAHKLRGG